MKFEYILSNTKTSKQLLNSNDRLHFQKQSKITKMLRYLAKADIKPTDRNRYSEERPCQILVTVFSPTRRRLDPPNFYPTVKALIDGYTDGGLWKDDNHEIVKRLSFEYGGTSGIKGKYRLEIEVKDVLRTNSVQSD